MPGDNTMRVSARPKPLRDLFCKYAPQARGGSPQPVRPLGVLRRPGSGQSGKNITSERELSDLDRVYLYLTGGGMDGYKVPYLASAKCLADVLQSGKTQKNLPRLSKGQTFEHQYKLAVSRDGLSTPRTTTKSKPKSLITLPMYQVKVNINTIEIEDSQAVESTRKSLRNLMEVGKIKASHPDNGVSANIKTFPFTNLIPSPNFGSSRSLESKPSKTSEVKLESNPTTFIPTNSISNTKNTDKSGNHCNFNETQWSEDKLAPDLKSRCTEQTDDKSRTETDFDRLDVRFDSVAYTPTDVNRTPISRGITRQDCISKGEGNKTLKTSSATLLSGSPSQNNSIRVTPYNEERALSGYTHLRPASVGSLTSGPEWSNLRDIQKLKVEACRQASQARRRRRHHSKDTGSSPGSSEPAHLKPCPTLRYTQLPRTLVPLDPIIVRDPIIVPSHSHVECPLCNRCSVPRTSSCPPNSPTLELETEENDLSTSSDKFIRVPCGDIFSDTRSEASTEVCDNGEFNKPLSNTGGDENQTTSEGEHQQNRPQTSSSQNSLYDVLIMPKVSMKYYLE